MLRHEPDDDEFRTGPFDPSSHNMVMYAMVAGGVSVGRLFLGGIIRVFPWGLHWPYTATLWQRSTIILWALPLI